MSRSDDDMKIPGGLTVERDDVVIRNRPNPEMATRKPMPAATQSRKGWLILLTVLVVVACGSSGWLGYQVYQLQQENVALQADVTWSRDRLEALGIAIEATGTSVSESGDTFAKKMEFFDSEIRKLWGVSYDKNRKSIADNAEAIEASSKSLTSSIDAVRSQLTEVNSQINKTLDQLKTADAQATRKLSDQTEQLLVLRSEVELAVSKLNEVPADLVSQVENHEEAIQAIDAARRQFASNISQLQQQVNQLLLARPSTTNP